jgi:hypothetical protein
MENIVETCIHREPFEIDRRLKELKLTREGLLRVRTVAIGASADATEFHPRNAAGLFAYLHGTWALRDEFVRKGWKPDATDGVEAILHRSARIKVIFANVDMACNDAFPPKPRSEKGAGAERACSGNLFDILPIYVPRHGDGWATYYLMLDSEGGVELSRPVVKDRTFSAYIERIYLARPGAVEGSVTRLKEDDTLVDFDPAVARK